MNQRIIHFPRTKKFSSLFDVKLVQAHGIRGRNACGVNYQISPTMSVQRLNDYYLLEVVPKQKVLDKICPTLMVSDTFYWQAIERKGGKTLIVLRYNLILGDRWVALIDTKTLPRRGE